MKKSKLILKTVISAFLIVFSLMCISVVLITDAIPEDIFLLKGEDKTISTLFGFMYTIDSPSKSVISCTSENPQNKLKINSVNKGTCELRFNLFGFLPIKNVSVTVGDERMLVPGGQSIGVMLYTDGALIVGCSELKTQDGKTVNPAKDAGLMPGDVIKSVNGVKIKNASHLSSLINSIAYGEIALGIERGGRNLFISVHSAEDAEDDKFRLGLWVRDSTAGVGTLTFYDPATGNFGGLGHAITDQDTGKLLSVKNGEVIFSDIFEIIKSSEGSPGALKGYFDPTKEVIGKIKENTEYGLYGKSQINLKSSLYPQMLPAGKRNDVHEGDAKILCSLDSGGVHEYDCKITNITRQLIPSQKSFVVEVTDENLLNITGGIVQGMSGSPVIQDGKLIGAVTHVIISEPKKGYGLYTDWMINEMEN